ncbi:single-stranded DNA-binding protein [Parasalinivibrio latis]|uniref:single-stranded DNA-binding protein n=1 Tax=Parasalinivibrio latis TaxID=2952610 RepID=UPI0030E0391D
MLIKLCRLGADAVLRVTPNGHNVAGLSLAYSIGFGANRETQWLEGRLWGERVIKLAPYLTKGRQVLVYADDIKIHTFSRSDGSTGATLQARILDITFTDSGKPDGAPPPSDPDLDKADWRDTSPPF